MESILKVRSALVAFGGNKCHNSIPTAQVLRLALGELGKGATRVLAVSRFFSSPAFPSGSGPDFVNGVARLETTLDQDAMLSRLHEVEAEFGRERHARWAERTLDLDLLAFENSISPDEATLRQWIAMPLDEQARTAPTRLVLPHPRLQDRAFVLIPLCDIAPAWRHPLTGKTAVEMRNALSDAAKAEIMPI